jgi:hypothetical protein
MRSYATGPARLRMMTSRARRWRVHSALRRSEWFSAIDRRQGAVTESCHLKMIGAFGRSSLEMPVG